jgi:hypothetical protein
VLRNNTIPKNPETLTPAKKAFSETLSSWDTASISGISMLTARKIIVAPRTRNTGEAFMALKENC